MFVVDAIMMSPFKGLLFIAKEIANAVDKEREADRSDAMTQLSSLHLALERGEIDEDEFDRRETELLDRLEQDQ